MTGRHRTPQAPVCPHCGQLQEPIYALARVPGASQRVLTGYYCPEAACKTTVQFLRQQYEDDAIARAVGRGVINQ